MQNRSFKTHGAQVFEPCEYQQSVRAVYFHVFQSVPRKMFPFSLTLAVHTKTIQL